MQIINPHSSKLHQKLSHKPLTRITECRLTGSPNLCILSFMAVLSSSAVHRIMLITCTRFMTKIYLRWQRETLALNTICKRLVLLNSYLICLYPYCVCKMILHLRQTFRKIIDTIDLYCAQPISLYESISISKFRFRISHVLCHIDASSAQSNPSIAFRPC